MLLGERLVELRGKRTQKYIAEQLGISRARYSHYENNYVQPDNNLLQKMADFYQVSIDFLLGREHGEWSYLEKDFFKDLGSIPLDEVIQKYPLEFMGQQLDLSDDERRAILAFVKTLQELKSK